MPAKAIDYPTFRPTLVVTAPAADAPALPSRLRRAAAHRWDWIGILALIVSSGAYGLSALLPLAW